MKQLIAALLAVFEQYRMAPSQVDQFEEKGKSLLAQKMETFVGAQQPLEFVMLGLPFKSTNIRDKVLGTKPDLGEALTMKNFREFHDDIRALYPQGVHITVASDGYVFNHLLDVTDSTVQEYKEINLSLRLGAPVSILDLNDFYTGMSLAEKRDRLITQFGISEVELERRIMMDTNVNWLYRGMMFFMYEELATRAYDSRNQHQKAAKKLTRQMMLYNEAYSNLVGKEFAHAIRLSMHQTVNDGKKYSINLIKGKSVKHSAWHSAVVLEDGIPSTIHRKDAIEAGYELVEQDNQPYYFIKP